MHRAGRLQEPEHERLAFIVFCSERPPRFGQTQTALTTTFIQHGHKPPSKVITSKYTVPDRGQREETRHIETASVMTFGTALSNLSASGALRRGMHARLEI